MIEYYKGDYKYLLRSPASYATGIVNEGFQLPFCWIAPDGVLDIADGYAWDGPSGITIDTKSFMRGSLIHDALYQLLRETGLGLGHNRHDIRRHQADLVLRDICLEDGMWVWRAKWVYRGVRLGGGPSAETKARKVYTAP